MIRYCYLTPYCIGQCKSHKQTKHNTILAQQMAARELHWLPIQNLWWYNVFVKL